jgi:hypothetical protein
LASEAVLAALNVRPEASLLVQIKNPTHNADNDSGAGSDGAHDHGAGTTTTTAAAAAPMYPPALQASFAAAAGEGERRFCSNADLPAFLDVAGTELLLVGGHTDVVHAVRLA